MESLVNGVMMSNVAGPEDEDDNEFEGMFDDMESVKDLEYWGYDGRSALDPYRDGFDDENDVECDLVREDWRD